jgi:hypothetical protein
LVASPPAKSIAFCDNRRTSCISAVSCLTDIAAVISASVKVGSAIDSSSWTCSAAIADASRRRALKYVSITGPDIAIASDRLSSAARHRSRSPSKPDAKPLPATRNPVAHRMVRGAIRIASRSG